MSGLNTETPSNARARFDALPAIRFSHGKSWSVFAYETSIEWGKRDADEYFNEYPDTPPYRHWIRITWRWPRIRWQWPVVRRR